MELEASNEVRDSSKAIDMLLNQMSSNMDEVSGLRQGLEDRLSKHVDVREALLKKKDEQLQQLQAELTLKGHETQEEQKRLNEMVEKLQSQLTKNECDLKSRESKLRRQQDQIDEDRRKLETEHEIQMASWKDEQRRLQVKKLKF